MSNTPHLGLPMMASNQSQKHVTFNEALLQLDVLVQLSVEHRDHTDPPVGPVEGTTYIVASAGAGGLWAGKENSVTAFLGGIWVFYTPRPGWLAYVLSEDINVRWTGTEWEEVVGGSDSMPLLGVNATADASNRLSVQSDGVLLSHDSVTPGSGDMRVTVNKSAAGKDAGFTFQSNWSTRALVGLLGDDDWGIKVSPDGSSFFNALVVDKDTGNVAIGAGSDANNRLLVSGESMLFTNAGDLRFTFSKGSSSDDCALTFQSNFSGRALFGLLGDDNFKITVSSDGSSYTEALVVNKDTGAVSLPQHPKFSAYMVWGGPDQYTPSGSWSKVGFNNTRHNDQGAYDAGNQRFVAPLTGYYSFGASVRYRKNHTDPTLIEIGFSINGAAPTPDATRSTGLIPAPYTESTSLDITALLKLTAGQTVEVQVRFTGNDGYIRDNENYFHGHMVP